MKPNPKLEDVLSPQEINQGQIILKLLASGVKQIMSRFLGPDMEFVVIARHKTEEQSMLIFAETEGDSKAAMTSMIAEAHARHNNGSMNEFNDKLSAH